MEFHHISILLEECLRFLEIKENGFYVDGTLGGAGHAYEVCSRLSKEGRFLGIDQDQDALDAAQKRLYPFEDRVLLVHDNSANMETIFQRYELPLADGILMDLGVSSYQLDEAERGFSYMQDAPLDMRMDKSQVFSAWDVVNTYSENELSKILTEYGEERWAKRIASFIIQERSQSPIETTGKLVEVIKKAVPKGARRDGPHPAKRSFQAIRIEVNGELSAVEKAIDASVNVLKPGGRLCIITFHSLEDRIVKNAFRRFENPCICPPEFPICVCGKKPMGRVVTRKPILPSEDEITSNPRARSAKLRVFEKM